MIDKERQPLVLQHWLNSIQYEEALSVRPKALRPAGGPVGRINLKEPTEGRTYFKLSTEEVAALLFGDQGLVKRPLDRELGQFFESWLARQYRRYQAEANDIDIMVAYPAVHLPRDELSGLFRFNVRIEFGYFDEKRFTLPKRSQRKAGLLPPPPDQVCLTVDRGEGEDEPRFFIDTRLLTDQLGLTDGEIDAVFEATRQKSDTPNRSQCFISSLLVALTGKPKHNGTPDEETEVLLPELVEEIRRRLRAWSMPSKVYPVGIVLDASRVRTTFHLQRDIKALLGDDLPRERPLVHAYLKGDAPAPGEDEHLGLYPSSDLTESQVRVANRVLGSRFTAAQGPPGTGKTTLIHHLAAHTLVSRAAALIDGHQMPDGVMMICSTNNRAVDNAIDPLADQWTGGLPLGLRLGSRQVVEQVSARQLDRALKWLMHHSEKAPHDKRKQTLNSALADFRQTRERLNQAIGPRLTAQKKRVERSRLIAERTALEREVSLTGTGGLPGSINQLRRGIGRLKELASQLEILSSKTEGPPSKRKLKRVARFFRQHVGPAVANAQRTIARLQGELPIHLPPVTTASDTQEALDRWEEGAEQALDQTNGAIELLGARLTQKRNRNRITTLNRRLNRLEIPEVDREDDPAVAQLKHAMFEQALEVREAFAIARADVYLPALRDALHVAERQASLRQLARSRPGVVRRLTQLFPVWGCTLLSLGNVFDERPGSIERIIIDEAGQCHPAYAISALMRAKNGLVIGDVHQLTPVFGLSRHDATRLEKQLFGEKQSLPEAYRVHDRSYGSVQALAQQAVAETVSLTDHFRCQPEIIRLSDIFCGYDLTVHTEPKSRIDRVPQFTHPVLFQPVAGEQSRYGGSWRNTAEITAVLELLEWLLNRGIAPEEMAVITPYRAQLYTLRRTLLRQALPVEPSLELQELEATPHFVEQGIALGTVHRFQGGERSVVLFSPVVTRVNSLPFLNDRVNLLNVAVSRAKEHLVILGHEPTLRHGSLTRHLVAAARPL